MPSLEELSDALQRALRIAGIRDMDHRAAALICDELARLGAPRNVRVTIELTRAGDCRVVLHEPAVVRREDRRELRFHTGVSPRR